MGAGSRKSDADLVADALRGAKEPLAELVARHWGTAVFLAARVLGSADLARDAAQEAAIAAMTDLDRLRSPERFGAWFCGIALNVARRWLLKASPAAAALSFPVATAQIAAEVQQRMQDLMHEFEPAGGSQPDDCQAG